LGTILVLFIAGFWMGSKAEMNAKKMKSNEWIRNDRCLAKVGKMPDPGDGFRFAVFGDIQMGVLQFPRTLRALDEKGGASFIVQTGDASTLADPWHYNLLMNELATSGLKVPMFVIPGNHDVSGDDEGLFEQYFGPKRFWFRYGNALFVLLDNAMERLDEADYDWLENVLESRREENRHVFLFMHCEPIYCDGDKGRPLKNGYGRLSEIADRHEIDYIFTGNFHGYHREERNGTAFVVNGRGGDFDHNAMLVPCYFTIVDVNDASIHDTCVELPPRVGIVMGSLLKDWLIAHIYRFPTKSGWIFLVVLIIPAAVYIVLIVLSIRMKAHHSEGKDGP